MDEGRATPSGFADETAPAAEVTRLLNAAVAGDAAAPDALMNLVYEQLRGIAQLHMARENSGHTLQATALVNEACIRLLGRRDGSWSDRQHFYHAAAAAMRRILIDHARAKNADKRGGGRAALAINSVADLAASADPSGFLALDDAILRLEKVSAAAAAIVRLRFFAGLSEPEVAQTLNLSERTVRREWAYARGWLRDALERDGE